MPNNMRRYTGIFADAGLQRARESAIAGAARRAAKLLEAQGQGGDRHLVHLNDAELAATRHRYGPGGGAGRRNPVTGLESFAPETDDQADDMPPYPAFTGTNPDGSGYTIRMPQMPDPAREGYETLRQIMPRSGDSRDRSDPTGTGIARVPEDSWGTVLWKGLVNNGPEFKKGIGGLSRALGEAFSAQPTVPSEVGMPDAAVQGYAPPAARTMVDWGTKLHDKALAELMANAPNVDPNSAKALAYQFASSLPQTALLLASAATGTTIPMLGALAVQGFGSRYGDARQEGRSAAQATADATVHAVAESVPMALPVGLLMQPGGRFLGRMLGLIGTGGAQGALTQAIDEAYAKGIIGTDTSWGEAWDRIKRAGLVGAGTGAIFGGASGATRLVFGTPPKSVMRNYSKFVDDNGFTHDEAIPAFLKQADAETGGHEHMIVMDMRTQRPLAAVTSEDIDGVNIPRPILRLMRKKGNQIALFHNHMDSTPHSPGDLGILGYTSAHSVHVIGPLGLDYSASLRPSIRSALRPMSDRDFRGLIREAAEKAYDTAADSLLENAPNVSPAAAHLLALDTANRALARAGVIKYDSNVNVYAVPRYSDDYDIHLWDATKTVLQHLEPYRKPSTSGEEK